MFGLCLLVIFVAKMFDGIVVRARTRIDGYIRGGLMLMAVRRGRLEERKIRLSHTSLAARWMRALCDHGFIYIYTKESAPCGILK